MRKLVRRKPLKGKIDPSVTIRHQDNFFSGKVAIVSCGHFSNVVSKWKMKTSEVDVALQHKYRDVLETIQMPLLKNGTTDY